MFIDVPGLDRTLGDHRFPQGRPDKALKGALRAVHGGTLGELDVRDLAQEHRAASWQGNKEVLGDSLGVGTRITGISDGHRVAFAALDGGGDGFGRPKRSPPHPARPTPSTRSAPAYRG